jgi:hypothetical protein
LVEFSSPFRAAWAGWESTRGTIAEDKRGKANLFNHPKELFGGRIFIFLGPPAAMFKEMARACGPRPAYNRTATPADSLLEKGEHHVRTLYGEGTACDLLRAI